MAAQNTHENTEEIIDLTELIEKGSVPETAEDIARSTAADNTDLQSHMRNLNDQVQLSDAEDEIDNLLAQMDSMGDSTNAEASPAAGLTADGEADARQDDKTDRILSDFPPVRMPDGHIVDPHEELHMPGMGDVDNLLSSLDIPPQPRAQEAAAPLPKETDDAVDKMLSSLNGASCPSPEFFASDAEQAPQVNNAELDELLAVGTMSEPVISDELEALLQEAGPAASRPDSQHTPAPEAPAPEAPDTVAQQAAPAHEDHSDLDALLQSILAEQPDQGAGQTPAPTATDTGLDDQAAQNMAHAPQATSPLSDPTPSAPESAGLESDMTNLVPDLAADLDMLIASLNQTESTPAGGGTDQSPASGTEESAEKLEFDLDALLAAADAEERGLQQASTAAPQAASAESSPEDKPTAPNEAFTADQPQAAPASFEAALDDILAGNTTVEPDALDKMLDQAGSAVEPDALDKMVDQAGSAVTADTVAVGASSGVPASSASQISGQDMTALVDRLDQYAMQLQQADERVTALESAVAEARAEAEQARNEADEARSAALQAQAALDDTLATAQSAHESVAQTAAEALHTAQGAAQAVANASAQQQTDKPESAPSVEDLFAPDHPLHQRLLDLVAATAADAAATAAREAANIAMQSAKQQTEDKPLPENQTPAQLENLLDERLDAINLLVQGATARLDSIEERLDKLEPRFNDKVEKAAAAAAARILREEIGRLLENE